MLLTERQFAVLEYIREYTADHYGVSPSYEEIRVACGMASKGHVNRIVKELEQRGKIVRLAHRARAIQVVDAAVRPPRLRIIAPDSPAKPRVDYTSENAEFWRWDDVNKKLEKK